MTTPNAEQTPIAEILETGRGSSERPTEAPAETARAPQPSEAATTSGPAGDDSAARETKEPNWVPREALFAERQRRKELTNRVRELEEENRVMLDARHSAPYPEQGAEPAQHDHDPQAAFANSLNVRASKAEFIAENGKAAFKEFEDAIERAAQAGNPHLVMAAEAAKRTEDPIGLMYEWARLNGLVGTQQQPQARQTMFPSNFAGARNVGARNPQWSGAQSVESIFNTKRSATGMK
jgi:hypothetical protein